MKKIIYKYDKNFDKNKIKKLYDDAGWVSYTDNLLSLIRGIESSLMVISAWDEEELVGLIRVIGDGQTIIYIQDILVLKSYKRKGIGTKLVNLVLEHFPNVRQKVLITDNEVESTGFYNSLDFESADKFNIVCFLKFN